MGREVKRVPLDFDWPMKEIWKGYINDRPDLSKKCVFCGGTGNSSQYQRLHDQWYGYVPFDPARRGVPLLSEKDPAVQAFAKRNIERSPDFYGAGEVAIQYEATRLATMWRKQWSRHLNQDDINALVEAGRLKDFTDTWTQGEGWKPKVPAYIPTPKEVNEWSILSMGHDAVNAWVCIKAECKRNGWETSCAICEGKGYIWPSVEAEEYYEAWISSEPPSGDGWQMWETTSEGSPMSPVFASPEELARWLTDTRASSCGSDTASYDQWLKMIVGPGWAPDLIGMPGHGLVSGVVAVSEIG